LPCGREWGAIAPDEVQWLRADEVLLGPMPHQALERVPRGGKQGLYSQCKPHIVSASRPHDTWGIEVMTTTSNHVMPLTQVCRMDASVDALAVRAFDWRTYLSRHLRTGRLIDPDASALIAWHGLPLSCVNWGIVDKTAMAIQPGVKVPSVAVA
jgi:hypothetical protein